jgi:hypothetical protein
VGNMWQQEENIHGIDTHEMREMMGYISAASAHARGESEGRGSQPLSASSDRNSCEAGIVAEATSTWE